MSKVYKMKLMNSLNLNIYEIYSIRGRNQEITGIINLLHCLLSEQGLQNLQKHTVKTKVF